mmetsp:Transcript_26546/g.76655  ORF Transcript_26546/g.76655 Transcript_26546/m.76655 type:complete len:285 (-) Transcript_26546:71-925(-)
MRATLLRLISISASSSSFFSSTGTSIICTSAFATSTVRVATRGIATPTQLNMGWSDTWNDILSGGNVRWKITCDEAHKRALDHFERYVPAPAAASNDNNAVVSVFCPLAGDDPMVYNLWKRGYSVTTIDMVPAAVEAMRKQFEEGSWTESADDKGTTTIWTHDSGRATLYVGDALQSRSELHNKFDAAYDKDSFGALGVEMRNGYCNRIAEYCKPGAKIYLEVKLKDNHEQVKDAGPPFSLKKEQLMEESNYGDSFEYVESLGSVYDISIPSAEQTGHILSKTE